jgi:glutamine amidotransferase
LSLAVTLVDYGMGNLRSVARALEHVGATVEVSADPTVLARAACVALPGVGAFGEAARRLQDGGLWEPLRAYLAEDRPFLGICLGMQLLYEESDEHGRHAGLAVFPGAVRRLPDGLVKVPHIGWNRVHPRPAAEAPLAAVMFGGIEPGTHFYYDQSYCCPDTPPACATTEYGVPLAAAAARGRVWACQFHPEKSQAAGLRLLANFLAATAAVPA